MSKARRVLDGFAFAAASVIVAAGVIAMAASMRWALVEMTQGVCPEEVEQ